jgi:hypothetical protein
VDRQKAQRTLVIGMWAAGLALVSFGAAFYISILYIS